MLALVYIVVGLTLAPFIWTLCLYPGARFFQAPNARWKRLFLLATILGVVAVGLTIGFALAPQSLPMAAGFVMASSHHFETGDMEKSRDYALKAIEYSNRKLTVVCKALA